MNTVIRNESIQFVSIAEAALRFGVDAQTVRRWAKSGHIRAVQPGGEGGVIRISAAEIDRLAEGQATR
jgi:excisionase family DNA binding protein